MTRDFASWLGLIWQSVIAPRDAARIIIGFGLSRAVLWQALCLVTLVSVILVAVTQGPMPEMPADGAEPIEITPFAYAMILGASLVMLVFGLYYTGRAVGGTGDFAAALAIVIWLEVMAIAIRLVLTAASLFSPALGPFLSLLGAGVLFWALINFINELHQFQSLGKALLTIVMAVIGISLGVAILLTLIGVSGGSLNV